MAHLFIRILRLARNQASGYAGQGLSWPMLGCNRFAQAADQRLRLITIWQDWKGGGSFRRRGETEEKIGKRDTPLLHPSIINVVGRLFLFYSYLFC